MPRRRLNQIQTLMGDCTYFNALHDHTIFRSGVLVSFVSLLGVDRGCIRGTCRCLVCVLFRFTFIVVFNLGCTRGTFSLRIPSFNRFGRASGTFRLTRLIASIAFSVLKCTGSTFSFSRYNFFLARPCTGSSHGLNKNAHSGAIVCQNVFSSFRVGDDCVVYADLLSEGIETDQS